MARSFLASPFHPPSVDSASASAAASTTPRYPDWVLLDRKAYFADLENDTTATATSRTGHTVKVTFCLADPPSLSHFCVHGPEIKPDLFHVEPQVVFSEKDLALLVFAFTGDSDSIIEYFIYKAEPGRGNPSLKSIPATPPGTRNTKYVSMVVCDDGEFFLADLFVTSTTANYDLSIFSSKMNKWTARTLQVQAPAEQLRLEDLFMVTHKAISLGGGIVGWVDLWRGVIVCDILKEDPFIYFIPLPKPDFNLPRKGDPKPIRDVTGNSGVIKFVEMDHSFRPEVVTLNNNPTNRFKVTKDLDSEDNMFDLDMLLLPHEFFPEVPTKQITYLPNNWKIRTCYRHISLDHWCKGHIIHVDDILANNPKHSVLLPQLWDGCGKTSLRKLSTVYPTLSPKGDDVLYLMSKVDISDKNAWMVGINLGNKTVEILEPYFAGRASYFKLDCVTCAFSEFLNTTRRSCGEKTISFSRNFITHGHLSSDNLNHNEPLYGYSSNQHTPLLSPNFPQPLRPNLTSSEPGLVHPVNSQPMYPVLNADTHGQLWLSMPLGGPYLSQLLQLVHPPSSPPMPQVPVPGVQHDCGPANAISPPPEKRLPPSVQPDSGYLNNTSTLAGISAAPALSALVGMSSPQTIRPKDDIP